MAYKQKGYKAHDNMKVLPKDLSGRSSANQRTPQIKPGKSPGKLRMANPNTGIDEAWNANSNISTGMGNLASNATRNIYQNQNNTGFTNNPMLNSSAGNSGSYGGYGDFYGKNVNKNSASTFNSKAAMEAARTKGRTVSAGMTRDLSEKATRGTGSIQDMINATVSKVQSSQDATRAKGLETYKANEALAQAKRKAENDARFDSYKASSQSKYNKLKGSYDKMTAAQKAAAAKPKKRSSSGFVGALTGNVTKAAGGIVKGISRGIKGIFGRRRKRRSSTKKKITNTAAGVANFTNNKKKTTTTPKRRRRRRRFFSDVRLKQNITLVGLSKSGIPIYNFSYIGDNTMYQGTMAQDLISMGYNKAITKNKISGHYMVDYNSIDVDMIKLN